MVITHFAVGDLSLSAVTVCHALSRVACSKKRDSGTVRFGSPLERGRGVFLEQCLVVRHGVQTHPCHYTTLSTPSQEGNFIIHCPACLISHKAGQQDSNCHCYACIVNVFA